ncbi:argininosuccinate lyase [Candidatus Nitronereus thalassa]|uniref:Argininosuccinate lyase n=1 Tax=Candidatus Nitronereus thalassa TaxID=3020898 RepID=A0ABU3K9E8_9BACT|nr:argininosuccinate lyase [Candidatus Nitronereus thalassa]MDT7043011.1 argininosuccinate lyase [Candidatus Nitronereus thalassa]
MKASSSARRKKSFSSSQATRISAKKSSTTSAKAWAGRFTEPTNALVERFTTSLPIDRQLFEYDIQGSMAHCQTLEKAKVLSKAECQQLIRGLTRVRSELREGRFPFTDSDEDIHMVVERRLTELIGPLGGKLHTGRSRNDQVTLDLRLYLREQLQVLHGKIHAVQAAFVQQASQHINTFIPGYTHLQRAQPVSLAHHFLAYVEMLERDKARIADALRRVNVMPLGSGALAGSNYPTDRTFTAKLLNFPALSQNSLDAVSDRDYVVEVLNVLSLIMMHLSRLSEELIVWSSQEFSFVELPDGFCTGSSMMPQKKNPDVPELIRGKTGRVYGHLVTLLTTLKGLPLSYNRDLQEDKEPLFDALQTVLDSLSLYAGLIQRMTVRKERVAEAVGSGFLLATELADYLVQEGVPFREAHSIVGRLVQTCIKQKQELGDVSLDDLRTISPRFTKKALNFLTVEGAVDRKAQIGGTARKQVARQLKTWEQRLKKRPSM